MSEESDPGDERPSRRSRKSRFDQSGDGEQSQKQSDPMADRKGEAFAVGGMGHSLIDPPPGSEEDKGDPEQLLGDALKAERLAGADRLGTGPEDIEGQGPIAGLGSAAARSFSDLVGEQLGSSDFEVGKITPEPDDVTDPFGVLPDRDDTLHLRPGGEVSDTRPGGWADPRLTADNDPPPKPPPEPKPEKPPEPKPEKPPEKPPETPPEQAGPPAPVKVETDDDGTRRVYMEDGSITIYHPPGTEPRGGGLGEAVKRAAGEIWSRLPGAHQSPDKPSSSGGGGVRGTPNPDDPESGVSGPMGEGGKDLVENLPRVRGRDDDPLAKLPVDPGTDGSGTTDRPDLARAGILPVDPDSKLDPYINPDPEGSYGGDSLDLNEGLSLAGTLPDPEDMMESGPGEGSSFGADTSGIGDELEEAP